MDERLIELLRAGLSPAEALDYRATVDGDYSQAAWAREVRGVNRSVGRKAVNKNVMQAKRKLATRDL